MSLSSMATKAQAKADLCRERAAAVGCALSAYSIDGGTAEHWERHAALLSHTAALLEKEAARRLWALYDAARALCDDDAPERWENLFQAVANVPESSRPAD